MHVGQIVSSEEPRSSPSLKDIRIQKNGSPFVITNYHQAFSYDTRMNSWLRISDAWFIISEFWGSGSSTIEQHPLGWLSTALKMTGSRDSTHESIMVLSRIDPDVSSTVTISHIEVRRRKEPWKMLQVIDVSFWIVKVHALTQSR